MADPELEIVADIETWRAQFYQIRFPSSALKDEERKYLNVVQNALKRFPDQAGPQGFQGVAGTAGPQGTTGPQGYQGAAGSIGSAGPQGYQGTPGSAGSAGSQGPQGYQGTSGCSPSITLGTVTTTTVSSATPPRGDVTVIPGGGCAYSLDFDFELPQGPQGYQGDPGPQGVQGATGAQGDPGAVGPMGDPGNDGPAGDKLAIVPVGDSYVALFCSEAPEVRFDDVVTVRRGVTILDPIYQEVCEPGSIKAVGYTTDKAAIASVVVKGHELIVDGDVDCNYTVQLSGIRRGRAGLRFPLKTAREMQINNYFWSQAKEGR